jgi:integrase
MRNNIDQNFQNHCDTPMMKKFFRNTRLVSWNTIDEIIVKTAKTRNRLYYEAARAIVKKAANMAGVKLRPHDLCRHAATDASRSDIPIEIVIKMILRQANLSTTQRYLEKVSDAEAIRWIDNLYT